MGTKNNKNKLNKEKIMPVLVVLVGIALAAILKYKLGKTTDKAIIVIVCAIGTSIYLLYREKLQSIEDIKKKQKIIREEYPFFVQKFSMLAEAGLGPRQIFIKMGDSYLKRGIGGNAIYDETLLTVRELSNGIAEAKAYQNFAQRCGIREMYVFVSVLNQNMRKGSAHLGEQLKKLSDEAMMEQKNEIKKRGELAGSKLLIPMMMLLVIVFVIIMVPAFMSFTSFL